MLDALVIAAILCPLVIAVLELARQRGDNCGRCAHYRAGRCSKSPGTVCPVDWCELFTPVARA